MWIDSGRLAPIGAQVMVRLMSYAQGLLAVIGLTALVLAAVPESRRFLSGRLAALQEGASRIEAGQGSTMIGTIQPIRLATHASEARVQRALIEFIAKRYRVSDRAVSEFVTAAYRAGAEFALDPVLLLAVMAIESRYNPVAESVVGAKGLMQVIPRFHGEKLHEHGGEAALLDPEVNIYVGAQILREYLRRFGQLETALQVYGGAFDEPTRQYATKVLAERAKLDQVVHRIRSDA